MIILPEFVKFALNTLKKHEHNAYIVGGCVRDALLCKSPCDYDICTSAKPNEIIDCFKAYRTIETGIAHGTVTVIIDNNQLEITTFRKEGDYSDHRRPNNVVFVKDICDDLSRRDFTMNAIAYNDEDGLIDPFGGIEDINEKIIRTVGNSYARFAEDSLRMLRALRFSSTLGFKIEEETQSSIKCLCNSISFASAERQCIELKKMLLGADCVRVIRDNKELVFQIIPELKQTYSCAQNSPYHCYNVFEHTMVALENCPNSLELKLAILLHDIAKPVCKTSDKNFRDHFDGHYEQGAIMAKEILTRLKFDKKTVDFVSLLIKNHKVHDVPHKDSEILHFFKKFGYETTLCIFQIMLSDLMGKAEHVIIFTKPKLEYAIIRSSQLSKMNCCYKISDLKITGNDLIKLGKNGKEIGEILNEVLDLIIDEKINNDKNEIIEFIFKK